MLNIVNHIHFSYYSSYYDLNLTVGDHGIQNVANGMRGKNFLRPSEKAHSLTTRTALVGLSCVFGVSDTQVQMVVFALHSPALGPHPANTKHTAHQLFENLAVVYS